MYDIYNGICLPIYEKEVLNLLGPCLVSLITKINNQHKVCSDLLCMCVCVIVYD